MKEHTTGYSNEQITTYLLQANFEKEKIKTGYFEFNLNNWVYATK